MSTTAHPIIAAGATNIGKRHFNADSYHLHWHPAPSSGVLGVALFDGIGDSSSVADTVSDCARSAVRVAARREAVIGMLAAHEEIADDSMEFPRIDAVGIVLKIRPNQPAVAASVGDCRAHGFDGHTLITTTVDATKGNRLRRQGHPEDVARNYDNVPITTVARASIFTIVITEILELTVLLTTDGVHNTLSHQQMSAIMAEHAADPGTCAKALVDAAAAAGAADNATAVVVHRPGFQPDNATLEGR